MALSAKQMEFTAFLEEKCRKFFRFLDVPKKGFLTEKTFAEIAENVRKTNKADGIKAAGMQEVSKWWTPLEPLAEDGRVDESRFIQVMKFIYSDPHEFERFQVNCEAGFSRTFQAINQKSDGEITRDELCVCYKWFGVTDTKFCEKVFGALDIDSDGLVTKVDLIEALHKYFFSNDKHVGCSYLFG